MSRKMNSLKTVKVPLYFNTTETKIKKLDKLTARLTYAVRLWSKIVGEHNLKSMNSCSPFESKIKEKTKLSTGFVQQSRDKALWMWRQYRKAHKIWEGKLRKAKKGKWYEKLLKREPSKPCTSKRSNLKKIPIRIDKRTGKVKEVDLKLTNLLIDISTLKKHEKIALLLNPSQYHIQELNSGKIKDFELVKKGKYYAHISVEYEVPTQIIHSIVGVDLGVKRDITSVKLPLNSKDFSIVVDTEKKSKLKKLNDRVSHLRRDEKWEVLKRMRNNRLNFAVDRDRKLAKEFVENYCHNSLVVIGHPEYICYNKSKGDGSKIGRKILRGWSFSREAGYIIHNCSKQGILSINPNEWGTSSECYKCGGRVKSEGRRITCLNCGSQYDRDFNSAINIALRGNALLSNKSFLEKAGATDDIAQNWRGVPTNGMSPEPLASFVGSPTH